MKLKNALLGLLAAAALFPLSQESLAQGWPGEGGVVGGIGSIGSTFDQADLIERYVGQQFQGQHQQLAVREILGLNQAYNGRRVQFVILRAQSAQGFGRAQLLINGQMASDVRQVGAFMSEYIFSVPGNGVLGQDIHSLRIDLNGRIFVESVAAQVEGFNNWPPPPPPPPPPVYTPIQEMRWSSSGPIPGMYCERIFEPADPHTWGDNYLCTYNNYGFRWSSAGPIPGYSCVQFYEPADPHTWNDNFLCSPQNLNLRWSSAGPIPGLQCLQIAEPADPNTWMDNYLCGYPY